MLVFGRLHAGARGGSGRERQVQAAWTATLGGGTGALLQRAPAPEPPRAPAVQGPSLAVRQGPPRLTQPPGNARDRGPRQKDLDRGISSHAANTRSQKPRPGPPCTAPPCVFGLPLLWRASVQNEYKVTTQ